MRIRSETLMVELPATMPPLAYVAQYIIEQDSDAIVLRWGVLRIDGGRALVEVARLSGGTSGAPLPPWQEKPARAPRGGVHVAVVIPTGVGARVGGYVGDAGPVVRVFEAIADTVIVHPNVVNGADLYGADASLYVDGLTFDRFLEGRGALQRRVRPRIGLILDRLGAASHARILNAANGWRAVVGGEIVGYVRCREQLRSRVRVSAEKHFIGEVDNAEVLFEASEHLQRAGANCLAVVSDVEGTESGYWTSHYSGDGTNPIGALEALISRAITWKTGLPCAHAPSSMDCVPDMNDIVDPRAAADVASGTGLPCVLHGLAHHAALVEESSESAITASDLSAVIVPFGCAGGIPALAADRIGVPLVAVTDNASIVGAAADTLRLRSFVPVSNYAEAIGFVAALKAGVDWACLARPLEPIQDLLASGCMRSLATFA